MKFSTKSYEIDYSGDSPEARDSPRALGDSPEARDSPLAIINSF